MPIMRVCANCGNAEAMETRDRYGDIDGEATVCPVLGMVVDPDGPGCDLWVGEWE